MQDRNTDNDYQRIFAGIEPVCRTHFRVPDDICRKGKSFGYVRVFRSNALQILTEFVPKNDTVF